MDEKMSTSENAPVSYYGDNGMGSGASAALLAGIATKDNYNPVDMVSANGINDLRHDVADTRWIVKDSESEIRRDVAKTEAEVRRDVVKSEADISRDVLREGQDLIKVVMGAECNLSKEILETRHSLAKDILRAEYENKLAVQTAIKELKENAQYNADRTQDKLDHGFEENDEDIEALSEKVDKGFFHAREEALEEKVDSLRDRLQTQTIKEYVCGCGGIDILKK